MQFFQPIPNIILLFIITLGGFHGNLALVIAGLGFYYFINRND